MKVPPDQLPDWLLERAALGEGPEGLEADADALAELKASNERILSELPPAMVAAEIERRLARRPARRLRASHVLVPTILAAAAVALLVVVKRDPIATSSTDEMTDSAELDSGIRIKGDIRLVVHRKLEGRAIRLEPDAVVKSGDLLQLSTIAAGQRHGVVVSLDGRGQVTLHFPTTADGDTLAAANKVTPLPHAYRLDDAPGYERFFFVASAGPVDPPSIVRAARDLATTPHPDRAPLVLPPGLVQTSFIVRKSETP